MREIIRQLRLERNLTQREVAEYLQIDRSTYTYYESGRTQINVHVVIKLAHFYQVSYATLLGRPEPARPPQRNAR
jgi:transcriptional regulator with XRE-family HTH domain